MDDKSIGLFTEHVGAMLSRALGKERTRVMVMSRMASESAKNYLNLCPATAWHPGGQAWRYFMFLAGCCIITKDDAIQLWGRVPPTALWRERLRDEDGEGFGHQWLKECLIETGRTGKVGMPDDDSTSWQEGVRRNHYFGGG